MFKKAVITIGTFDGVHIGHQKIIEQVKSEAKKIGGTSILITFFPHPKRVIRQEDASTIQLLSTQAEKLRLLSQYGLENVVVVPFDTEFAAQTPEEYIEDFLVKRFHPHTIIIGYDHKFGKGRKGNFELLESESSKHNYVVKQIPEKLIKDITVSSTKIRKALLAGDILSANTYLGHAHTLSGTVVEGNKLGRTIGYPTANIEIDDDQKLLPANGVYAVLVQLGLEVYSGMLNIGLRPTVGGSKRMIEVNIFEFDKQIYGEVITLSFGQKLRDEQKFKNLDFLKDQLAMDRINAKKSLEAFPIAPIKL